MIKTITKYKYKSKEYNNLKEIKEEIHNTIGFELLDEMKRRCPLQKHKDYQTLLDLICSSKIRKMLLECLNVEHSYFDEYEEKEVFQNVLDLTEK